MELSPGDIAVPLTTTIPDGIVGFPVLGHDAKVGVVYLYEHGDVVDYPEDECYPLDGWVFHLGEPIYLGDSAYRSGGNDEAFVNGEWVRVFEPTDLTRSHRDYGDAVPVNEFVGDEDTVTIDDGVLIARGRRLPIYDGLVWPDDTDLIDPVFWVPPVWGAPIGSLVLYDDGVIRLVTERIGLLPFCDGSPVPATATVISPSMAYRFEMTVEVVAALLLAGRFWSDGKPVYYEDAVEAGALFTETSTIGPSWLLADDLIEIMSLGATPVFDGEPKKTVSFASERFSPIEVMVLPFEAQVENLAASISA